MGKKKLEAAERLATAVERMSNTFEKMAERDAQVDKLIADYNAISAAKENLSLENIRLKIQLEEIQAKLQKPLG